MTFWLLALLLGVMASAFVLLPLMYRGASTEQDRDAVNVSLFNERLADLDAAREAGDIEQAEYDRLVSEAKRDLLQDTAPAEDGVSSSTNSRTIVWVLAALVPVFAILMYGDFGFGRGSITDLELSERLRTASPHDRASYEELVADLADRMASQPDNIDGQFLLASTYRNLEQFHQAVPIYKSLAEKFPDDSRLASHYAETLFLAEGRKMTPVVVAAVEQALKLDPSDLTMLEVQAIAAIEAGDYGQALSWFQRALATGVQGERARIIKAAMEQVRVRAGIPAAAGESNEAQGRGINVLIEVGEEVDASAEAVVFVYARAVGGPPAPLAAQRVLRSDLPQLVRLDESMAMLPGMDLASFDEIQVIARISSTGDVSPSEGDYEARSETIDLTIDNDVIKLVITDKISLE